MVVTIEPEAAKYIEERAGSIFLEPEDSASACCGSIHERPRVRIGAPRDKARYEAQVSGNVTCHAPRGVPGEQHITIRLNRVLGIRWLSVDGWKVL